jgi:membrane protease YdiL (CAAX protease family)
MNAPELPDAAWPRWPPWYGPAALGASLVALAAGALPVLPAILLLDVGGPLAAFGLLALILVQDLLLVAAAMLFAAQQLPPRPWHFGARATRWWPTVLIATLGFALMLGLEIGYIELLDVSESNADDLGADEGLLAALLVDLAVIVVAPVAEEIFFRGFFYRALRTRIGLAASALIDGVVFGLLHFEGEDTLVILPVIATFGIGQCLVYEWTGSLYAVIAIHAAFNTVASLAVAPLLAIAVGLATIAGCVAFARQSGPAPSPFGPARRSAVPA